MSAAPNIALLRLAWRRLARQWEAVALAVVCFGVGTGGALSVIRAADTAWFGVPPGVHDAAHTGRAVVETTDRRGVTVTDYFAHRTIQAIAKQQLAGVAVVEMHEQEVVFRAGSQVQRQLAAFVSDEFFRTLGIQVQSGRDFAPAERESVVIVSERLAASLAGTGTSVLGQRVQVGRSTMTMIGVLPAGFLGTELDPVDVWLPLGENATGYLPTNWEADPGATLFRMFWRLPANVSRVEAEYRGTLAYDEVEGPSLANAAPPRTRMLPLALGRRPDAGEDEHMSSIIALLALLLWCAVCVNTGALLLVRVVRRRGEDALVLALGASPVWVLRLWFIEIIAIVGCGSVLALLIAWGGERAMRVLGLSRTVQTYASATSHYAGALVVLSCAAAAFGYWMVRRSVNRLDFASLLTLTGRTVAAQGPRAERLLVMSQLALSVAIVYAASLFALSLKHVVAARLGFVPNGLFALSVTTEAATPTTVAQDSQYRRIVTSTRLLPSVLDASLGVSLPFVVNLGTYVSRMEQPDRQRLSYIDVVTPHHFATMGLSLVHGRDFDAEIDRAGKMPSVVLSAELAAQLFGRTDAVGECVVVRDPPCRVVVGIVDDMAQVNLREAVTHVYLPLDQSPELLPSRTAFVRLKNGQSAQVLAQVREMFESGVSRSVVTIRSVEDLVRTRQRPWRLAAYMLGAFAVLSIFVSSVGIFGVVSLWTQRWIPEMGVRIALGAPPRLVILLFVRRLAPTVLTGLLLGGVVGIGASRIFSEELFEVSALNVPSLVAAFVMPALAAGVAMAGPLGRLLGTEPLNALRAY